MAKQLRIAFLGGVGEIGKNMTVFEYGEDIIMVDCGLSFPSMDETPGVDFIIPDYSYLMDKKDKMRAIFITHGHEDHIGALPYFLKDFNVPVYASNLAIGLISHKLQEAKLKDRKLISIEGNQVIEAGKFKVEFVKVTHSTAGSNAICITTPKGIVFVTGDFKIDHTPIDHKCTDLARIAEIGSRGVLLLMQDSTNVERAGYSMSESNVAKALDHQFELNLDKRIIVATFASNVHRVQQIIDCAVKHNRKVAFSGRSLLNVVAIARTIGELNYIDDNIIDLSEVNKIPFDRICIISTGTQGEPFSALTRMSNDDFKKVVISELDCVMFSSSPIPGNEKMIYTVINKLSQKGASVVYKALSEIHVSGHACQEELKLMFRLLNPLYFIPVHGEFRHLKAHKELAMSLGMSEDHIFLPQIGNYVEVDKSGIKQLGNIKSGIMLLDGSIAVEDEMLIIDRKKLSEDGFIIAIISTNISGDDGIIQPIIIVRGININDKFKEELSQDIMEELRNGSIDDCDINSAKRFFRKTIAKKLFQKLKRRPMVIPIILD
ncbi:MAG: ribonuclease J [Clostridia bacterium]